MRMQQAKTNKEMQISNINQLYDFEILNIAALCEVFLNKIICYHH